MSRSLSYRPNQQIKSKQTFVSSVTVAQNSSLTVNIAAVVKEKSKLIASNNPYGGNVIYGRMWYWNTNSQLKGITRNSNGSGSNGYIRYSVDVVEYYG
jgi:hypothetical protein